MSVVETDEQDRGTVVHYAPRHVRYPAEEHSIRPVLERLRRGESDAPPDASVEPGVHTPFPLDPPRKTIGWQLIACCVLSAALSAGFAVLAIGWLAPMKTESARIDSTQLDPKIVRTVSFQQPAANSAGLASEKQDLKPETTPVAAAAEPEAPSKAEPHRDQIAPKELLAMWFGIPPEARAKTPAPPSMSSGPEAQEPKVEAETPHPPRTEHREAAPHRAAHARRHSHHRASAARRSGAAATQAAAAAQTSETNPLQSALQSVFGGQAAAKPQQSPAKPSTASAPPQPQNY